MRKLCASVEKIPRSPGHFRRSVSTCPCPQSVELSVKKSSRSNRSCSDSLRVLKFRDTYIPAHMCTTSIHLRLVPLVSSEPAPASALVNFVLYNTRSVRNKGDDFVDLITDNDLDIIALTETGLQAGDTPGRGKRDP